MAILFPFKSQANHDVAYIALVEAPFLCCTCKDTSIGRGEIVRKHQQKHESTMMGVTHRFVRCALVALLCMPMPTSGQGISEPTGYRTEDYRAPTPDTLEGARVVTTEEAEQIWKAGGAIFIDVMPHAPRPANLPPGTIWREKPRRNIPGSIWLPDTGYGALAPVTENYLRSSLARVTEGNQTKALVVYCLRDCWMSWNAAKRILAMGYVNVVWYPDGTDGWAEAHLPLQESIPEPPSSQ
jgi:PQQ-dependent catabolism-associated CXXCW motif protein